MYMYSRTPVTCNGRWPHNRGLTVLSMYYSRYHVASQPGLSHVVWVAAGFVVLSIISSKMREKIVDTTTTMGKTK